MRSPAWPVVLGGGESDVVVSMYPQKCVGQNKTKISFQGGKTDEKSHTFDMHSPCYGDAF